MSACTLWFEEFRLTARLLAFKASIHLLHSYGPPMGTLDCLFIVTCKVSAIDDWRYDGLCTM